jgi:uncharacterized protein YndB with AHSA1/START domain
MTATAIDLEGKLAVRRSMFISAEPDRVWREFESFERMSRWWGTGHRLVTYEPRPGGTITMEVDVEGATHRFGGRIVVFDAGRELTWEDNWIGPMAWSTTIFSTLRLTPSGAGTLVEFIKHGFERLGDSAAEVHRGLERGWSIRQLDALRQIIEQRE